MTAKEAAERLRHMYYWEDANVEKALEVAISVLESQDGDTISRQAAIDTIKDTDVCVCYSENESVDDVIDSAIRATKGSVIASIEQLPSAQPEEVIPHRNYKYLSDYWCECGWHLGKKGEVKYCADCGRKVNWDE